MPVNELSLKDMIVKGSTMGTLPATSISQKTGNVKMEMWNVKNMV